MSKRNSDWYVPPDWLAIFGLMFLPGCIVILEGMLLPLMARLQTSNLRALYGFGLGAGVIGATLLLVARLPLYRQGLFGTVGPKQLDRAHRRVYWLAYLFVAASLLLLSVVWLRA
jgi:dipeptide/tripeptide permease